MSSERVIEVTGLTKTYKEVTAVNDLNLNVHRGDVFGFLGPNGAGKSTTIRMLLSLIKPTKGSIKIFDKELNKYRREILSKVGSIVEKPDFYLYLSAYKNLEILGKLSGTDTSKKRLMEVLEMVGLNKRADSKVKTFSHGMKQRLGLAQALLHDPELIILDEPTTGLDPQGMKEIRDLIIQLSKEQDKTILLSSHILREVELIANRMIIINKGTTRVEGTVEELMKSDTLKVTVQVGEPEKVKGIIRESQWNQYFEGSANNEFEFEMNKELVSELNKFLVERRIDVEAVIPKRSLEEYFLEITKENVE